VGWMYRCIDVCVIGVVVGCCCCCCKEIHIYIYYYLEAYLDKNVHQLWMTHFTTY
jgi:hypothetical protein